VRTASLLPGYKSLRIEHKQIRKSIDLCVLTHAINVNDSVILINFLLYVGLNYFLYS
jgi:hypothetical protein